MANQEKEQKVLYQAFVTISPSPDGALSKIWWSNHLWPIKHKATVDAGTLCKALIETGKAGISRQHTWGVVPVPAGMKYPLTSTNPKDMVIQVDEECECTLVYAS